MLTFDVLSRLGTSLSVVREITCMKKVWKPHNFRIKPEMCKRSI